MDVHVMYSAPVSSSVQHTSSGIRTESMFDWNQPSERGVRSGIVGNGITGHWTPRNAATFSDVERRDLRSTAIAAAAASIQSLVQSSSTGSLASTSVKIDDENMRGILRAIFIVCNRLLGVRLVNSPTA